MSQCCGKPRSSAFCPDCGKDLRANGEISSLLHHCRTTAGSIRKKAATMRWRAEKVADAQFAIRWEKQAVALERTATKWQFWGDALEDIIDWQHDNNTGPNRTVTLPCKDPLPCR